MHTVHITLKETKYDDILYIIKKQFGFRRIEVIQEPFDCQPGTSFYFKVNNIAIFISGACWIPAHSFVNALSPEDYQQWIKLATDGNHNMLRVWGGGIYENESFYQQCDRAGIMIWQDFMFACGQYPYYEDFSASVEKEVRQQVSRLKFHPSIVIYAGNNEDYSLAESEKLDYDRNRHSGLQHTNFPARAFYEKMFPNIIKQIAPETAYHPGSPWGGTTSNDPLVGDIHQWNVWHGSQEKYQDWAKLSGRFISEFGMQALPSLSTILKFITDDTEVYPQSRTMDYHNKASDFAARLSLYVTTNVRIDSMDIEHWIYATQLMQADCLALAYRAWRRQWAGNNQRYIGGCLVWQFNDCWPVTSWSICDFYKTPKLSYYSIKRENTPLSLGAARRHRCERNDHVYDVWGTNLTLNSVTGTLIIFAFDLTTGARETTVFEKLYTLEANKTTELVYQCPLKDNCVLQIQFRSRSNQIVAETSDWPQPLKYIKLPDRELKLEIGKGKVAISCNRPVKGVELYVEHRPVTSWSDNGVDVFPGKHVIIYAPEISPDTKVNYHYM